jgi:peroxiredoxin
MLKVLLRNIMVGDKLPELTLPIYFNNSLQHLNLPTLFDEKPYIMLGHPGAFTIISTNEQIPEYISEQSEVPVVLWSVNDPFVIKSYSQKYKIPFPVICDFNGELTRSLDLGLNEEDYFSYCCRRTLCIVKQGIVLAVSSELNVQYTKATKPKMAAHLLSLII